MTQEYIEIRGARENNLKDVSLRIPKRKITIFTGVYGSGKSSIVFDTIAAESQRLIETSACSSAKYLDWICRFHTDCVTSKAPNSLNYSLPVFIMED